MMARKLNSLKNGQREGSEFFVDDRGNEVESWLENYPFLKLDLTKQIMRFRMKADKNGIVKNCFFLL